jgi:nitroimidazol reductase NimA-like FMN-containing flavoprotein (pyridoxamine 5'-phosphate oxidase superfamily)
MDISGWATDAGKLAEFLSEPNLCRIATIDELGRPHVVPAWHWWDGSSFWIGAQAPDMKVAHIRARGTAGVEVDADLRRKRGVFGTGTARVIDGADGRREYVRITAEQVKRYQPDRPPHETAERYGRAGQPVVIQVTLDRMISWGR